MNKSILIGAGGIVVAGAMLAAGFVLGKPQAQSAGLPALVAQADAAEPVDRKEIELIIRDYLVANPEILVEMQDALEAKQKEEQRVASLKVIEQARDEIFNAPHDGVVGNPKGKVTIVEFYDYNCGYCRRAQDDMLALTAADPELRFVLKEFPILGPDSQKAHVVSMAVHKLAPDTFAEFHNQLLGSKGRATEEEAIKIALSLGLDEAKLREEMKNPEINDTFAKTYDLANKLSITGTPSYVVGNEVVFGALGKDVLTQKIAAAKQACTTNAC